MRIIIVFLSSDSFALYGNEVTSLKMKSEILYNAELKLGTFTKTFIGRVETKIARIGKTLSPVSFVYISK